MRIKSSPFPTVRLRKEARFLPRDKILFEGEGNSAKAG